MATEEFYDTYDKHCVDACLHCASSTGFIRRFVGEPSKDHNCCPGCGPANKACPAPAPAPAPTPTGFKKNDAGKPRFGLVAPHFHLDLAKCLTVGADKYGEANYLKGADWSRYIDAAERHLNAFKRGESLDPDDQLSHLVHLAACAMILFESERLKVGNDNRAVVTEAPPPAGTKEP